MARYCEYTNHTARTDLSLTLSGVLICEDCAVNVGLANHVVPLTDTRSKRIVRKVVSFDYDGRRVA